MVEDDDSLLRVAEAEVQRMRSATLGSGASAVVTMPVEDFRRLADLIERLSALMNEPAGATLDHCRYFVPLEAFRNMRNKALAVEDECSKLRTAMPLRFLASTVEHEPIHYRCQARSVSKLKIDLDLPRR